MRAVVVYELLSVDGVAEEPDRFFADWDDAMDANLAEVIATQDTVVLGRRSYEEWAGYWPSSDTTAVEGDLVEFVRELKERPGGDIGVHASISVARSLLAAGVVDELRLAVFPAFAGSGRRLLDDLPPGRLENLRTTTSPTGSVMARYAWAR